MNTVWFWLICSMLALFGFIAIGTFLGLRISRRIQSFWVQWFTISIVQIVCVVGGFLMVSNTTLHKALVIRDVNFFKSGLKEAMYIESNNPQYVHYRVVNNDGDWAYISFDKDTRRLRYSGVAIPDDVDL